MICVSVEKDSAKYKKITIDGHAMYDDYGKDIVCSAVSSIVITTVNGILALNIDSISHKEVEGNVEINVINEDHTTRVLLQNMLNLLKELEKSYPNNIQVK